MAGKVIYSKFMLLTDFITDGQNSTLKTATSHMLAVRLNRKKE